MEEEIQQPEAEIPAPPPPPPPEETTEQPKTPQKTTEPEKYKYEDAPQEVATIDDIVSTPTSNSKPPEPFFLGVAQNIIDNDSDYEDPEVDLIFNEENNDDMPYLYFNGTMTPRKESVDTQLNTLIEKKARHRRMLRAIRSKAEEDYQKEIADIVEGLNANHQKVIAKAGTSNDTSEGEWMIDPEEVDEKTLEKEINRLKLKLKSIGHDNQKIQDENDNLFNQLQGIQEQIQTINDKQ